ncbi:MAG: efflux RND transporter periplasmic adaptor subunit [Deltaproteobacteria bacterium]|nr:efflux RND transporter periplasmic adaptor subunit [Deltaproteobacteria bacterium]
MPLGKKPETFRGFFAGSPVIFMGVLVLLFSAACGKKEPPKTAPPPQEVAVLTVTPKTVPATFEFVAQAESSHQVEIVARVSGFLEKILYQEGEMVKEGQVMFQMDRKPFQAQVDAAKGEVENRLAQLWTAKANLDRIKPLAEQDAASKSDLDNAIGAVKSAEAAAYAARANLDKAQLDLSYTIIKSPVTGVSSKALLREGAYLAPSGSSSRLTYVARLNPIWVDFTISQNLMAEMTEEVRQGRISPPKNHDYEVELELSDGRRYPYRGKPNFADPSFSKETGTFLVRAEVPNPKQELRPGMFVKAFMKGAVRPNAITVPQKAVQQTANGHTVYVANTKNQAEIRPVVVGDWIGQDWIINQGLKAGDRIIVEGFQRLAPGAPVKPILTESLPRSPETAQAGGPAGKTASSPAGNPAKPAQPAAK